MPYKFTDGLVALKRSKIERFFCGHHYHFLKTYLCLKFQKSHVF